MQKLLSLCLLFVSFGALAQIQVTDSTIESFMKQRIIEVNQQIYQAALDGKIEVYWNDSFSTPITLDELSTIGSYEYVFAIDTEPFDSTIVTLFDWSSDVKGLTSVYSSQTKTKRGTITYQLQGIGPVYAVIAGEGIELGLSHLFLAERKSLKKVLSKQDLKLVHSLTSEACQFGDFRITAQKYYEATPEEIATENALRSLKSNSEMTYNRIDFTQNPSQLAMYLRHINSYLMSMIATKQESKYPSNKVLFKDISLKTPYIDPTTELSTGVVIQYGDETGELKDSFIEVHNDFFDRYDYSVSKIGDDYILDFTIENYGSIEKNSHVFMSFDKVKNLYPEHDRIVMEAFFSYLFMEKQ